jgi:8-oxo-dGTP pyrophosphatase MutT (NUDIX family)
MKIGVIIGRFQVPEWHKGHKALFEKVRAENDGVAIGLGVAQAVNQKNLLDYAIRHAVALKSLGRNSLEIFPVLDKRDDKEWSLYLDELLYQMFRSHEIRLYSGRDGFHSRYSGRHTVNVVENLVPASGTELRADVYKDYINKDIPSFAAGIIHGANLLKNRVALAVDVALVSKDTHNTYGIKPYHHILLGQKFDSDLWRLPGGMVDSGETPEQAAVRELREETGITPEAPVKYLSSFRVEDERYPVDERPLTMLFMADYAHGSPAANDDLVTVKWFDYNELRVSKRIYPPHIPLVNRVLNEIESNPRS